MKFLARWSVMAVLPFVLASGVSAEDKPVKKDAPKDAPADPPKQKDPKDMTLDECEAADPKICPVTRKQAKPIYHYKIGEKEYHFNTREAQKEFQANPEKYGYKK